MMITYSNGMYHAVMPTRVGISGDRMTAINLALGQD